MPVYNRPVELERALNAVLSQTYANIEIIVSNNCSPNAKVEELVKRYSLQDSRIKYYYQENPIPVIEHFKYVLSQATGEYFMFLADDDWLDVNYIEQCFSFLINNPNYSLACGECAYHKQTGELIEKVKMVSSEWSSPMKRVLTYYQNVKLNGYYYSLRKTSLSKQIPLQNKIGSDWLYLAALIFRGKVKVIENTFMHITAGGMSTDVVEMNKNMGANNFFTRNFVGLTASVNAALDIFKTGIYPVNVFSKFILSLRVFFTVLSKTFMWDVINIKRFLFGKRFNNN